MKKFEVPIYYIYLQKNLLDLANHQKEITVNNLKYYLNWWRIPKYLRMPVLKDMECYNLIKLDKKKITILVSPQLKLLENTSLLYKKAGLW